MHSVWVMNSDGSKKTQLTHLPVGCLWPAWSPDGAKIAFSVYSAQTHEGHIAVMRADGGHVTTLTTGKILDAFPDWTPDGRVVFLRKPFTETKAPGDLYVVNADGAGLARLTHSGNVGCFELSPDGSKIAFHDTEANQVKVMPADGSTPATVLIDDDFGWIFVAITWSPDGRALAVGCSSLEAASGAELHIVNADGSNLTTVPNVVSGLDPAWRPE
jgi:Tol biopolymer transport system component